MSNYVGRPMAPINAQADMLKSHVIRGASVQPKSSTPQHTFRLASPPKWSERAKCLDNSAAFDESVGLSAGLAAARCEGCPVIAECLAAALAEEGTLAASNRYTIRGGLSPAERATLAGAGAAANERKRLRYAAMKDDPEFLARNATSLRERRAAQTVSCLGCGTEMRTAAFGRHLARAHGEAA
jgi:hypothetical protein